MPLPSLPVELWMVIVATKTLSRINHLSLVLVSRDFNALSTPLLYENLTIYINNQIHADPVSPTVKFKLAGAPQQRLLELLESSEKHRHYVHHIYVKNRGRPNWNLASLESFKQLNFDILELLQECPRLQFVYCRYGILNTEGIARLATRLARGLSISLENCDIEGEVLEHAPFNITSLACSAEHISLLYPLIFGGSLESLRIDGEPWGPLIKARELLTFEPLFDSLTKISFPYFHNAAISLTPNTTNNVDNYSCGNEWRWGLPKLQSFHGPSCMFPRLVSGRAVTILFSWDVLGKGHTEVDLSTIGANFGSSASIRDLIWTRCWDLEQLVGYIVTECPAVEELVLIGVKADHGQNQTLNLLNEMKKLKRLSLLRIKYETLQGIGQPVKAELEWERSQCELVREGGCSFIAIIAFPSGSWWRRHPDDDAWKLTYTPSKA